MHTTKRTAISLATAAVPLLFTAAAFAGSIVRMETRDHRVSPAAPGTVAVSIEGSSMRMDATGSSVDDAGSLVFKSDVNEMTAIDHSRKQFIVIDDAALQSIAGQVGDAMQQMRDALAELPPEQRSMAEKMMQQRMGSMGQAIKPRTIAKTGAVDSVNGYDCEMYDVSEGGRKTRDMCVTSWADIEGGAQFAQSMVKMAGFFENMREMFSRSGMDMMGSRSDVFSHMREIDGFPVRARNYDERGRLVDETTLVSSETESVDPAIFLPPDGYTRQTMPR